MIRVRPIRILSVLLLLTIILIPTSMTMDGKIVRSIQSNDGDQIAEFNKTILEQSIVDAIELKDDDEVTGNVSYNETEIDFDVYHVQFEKGWLFFNFYREISLSRESDENGTIYLDVYQGDLEKLGDSERYMAEDQSNNWTEFNQDEIEGNELFLIIYGDGNYSLKTGQYLDREQALFLSFSNFIILSVITIVFTIIAGIIYYHVSKKKKPNIKTENNKNISKRDTIDIKKNIKKLKMISFINYTVFLIFLFLISLIHLDYSNNMNIFYELFFHVKNNNGLILNLLLNTTIFLVFIFFISYLIFYIDFQIKKEKFMKSTIPDAFLNKKEYKVDIIEEKIFLLERTFLLIIILLIFLSSTLYSIESFFKFTEYYCCNFIFLIFIIPLVILYPILVSLSFQTIVYKDGILKYYYGQKSTSGFLGRRKKFEKDEIKSIRPIPASMYFDLLPGVQRKNGKFKLVKTGVLIEDKNGKLHRVLTSRPMEIVSLMRK